MSIKVMSLVWDKSALKDTPLLLLLAIADYADDDGYAWPSIETLQRKIRVDSPRTVHYNLKKLVDSGELTISKTKGGRANTHGFQINVDGLKGAIAIAGFKKEKTLQSSAQTLQSNVLNPAIAIAPEPSLTVIEPSSTADADKNLSIANATKPEAIHPPTRTDDMTVKASTKKADDILMAHVARSEVGRLKNWDLTCAQIEEYAAALGKPKKVIRALADLRGLVSAGANAAGLRGYGKDSDLLEILRADIAPEDVRRMAEKDAHDTHAKNPKRGDYWASELVQAIRMTKAAAQKPTVIYVPEFN